jgi:integrase/recombinase XerD
VFTAADKGCKITRLRLGDLTFDRVLSFLRHLEQDRGNHMRTRNQRLAAVHSLFEYLASRDPELLGTCQQVAAIPIKRAAPPETRFLEQDEIEDLIARLPARGRLALRDRALVLFLYNTGARVQEAADLRAGHLDLGEHPLARLHGKGTSGGPARSGARPPTCSACCSNPAASRPSGKASLSSDAAAP